MDGEAIAIAVGILILLGELAWCLWIIGDQRDRIRDLEAELEELEGELRWQMAQKQALGAIALALEKQEERDPADWWKRENDEKSMV